MSNLLPSKRRPISEAITSVINPTLIRNISLNNFGSVFINIARYTSNSLKKKFISIQEILLHAKRFEHKIASEEIKIYLSKNSITTILCTNTENN